MKSIFLCFELCLICCLRESITCVFHSIPSTLIPLLVHSLFVNRVNGVSLICCFLTPSMNAFLLADYPVLGLLDSSLGYRTVRSISGDHKGFLCFYSFIHSFITLRSADVFWFDSYSHSFFFISLPHQIIFTYRWQYL